MSDTETAFAADPNAQLSALGTELGKSTRWNGKTFTGKLEDPVKKYSEPYKMGTNGRRFNATLSDNSEQAQLFLTKPTAGDGTQHVFATRVTSTGENVGIRFTIDGKGKMIGGPPQQVEYVNDHYAEVRQQPADINKFAKDNGLADIVDAAQKAGILPLKWDEAMPKRQASLRQAPTLTANV
jgi:hypothetical protein